MVAMGIPDTRTRGLGTVGSACPPCAHSTVAPTCKIGAGISNHRQSPYVDIHRWANQSDRGPLSIADINPCFIDYDHGSADTLKYDSAGHGRRRRIADQKHVLTCSLEYDILSGRDCRRCGSEDGNVRDQSPEASGPDGIIRIALFKFDPHLRPDWRHNKYSGLDACRRNTRHGPA